ncbi:MAG: universal stress protein [Pseudomonadota bacterium]
MIKRILAGVCRSPAQSAIVPMVTDLAANHSASVTGLALLDQEKIAPSRPPSTGVFSSKLKEREEVLSQAQQDNVRPLASLREAIEASGQAYDEQQVDGEFDESLRRIWSFQDLLVLSNTPWFAGEKTPRAPITLLQALADGIRPIISVPPYAGTDRQKALVALSGSLDSAKAMKHFVQLRPWPDIALHLVTVGEPKNAHSATELLNDAQGYATAHGFTVSTAALADTKDKTSALFQEAASVGADTLVVGSSYSRFLLREKFGSNVQQILAKFEGAVFLSH